jgi:hypothetical protein
MKYIFHVTSLLFTAVCNAYNLIQQSTNIFSSRQQLTSHNHSTCLVFGFDKPPAACYVRNFINTTIHSTV